MTSALRFGRQSTTYLCSIYVCMHLCSINVFIYVLDLVDVRVELRSAVHDVQRLGEGVRVPDRAEKGFVVGGALIGHADPEIGGGPISGEVVYERSAASIQGGPRIRRSACWPRRP